MGLKSRRYSNILHLFSAVSSQVIFATASAASIWKNNSNSTCWQDDMIERDPVYLQIKTACYWLSTSDMNGSQIIRTCDKCSCWHLLPSLAIHSLYTYSTRITKNYFQIAIRLSNEFQTSSLLSFTFYLLGAVAHSVSCEWCVQQETIV